MEPVLGTASFTLLALQFGRAQMLNMVSNLCLFAVIVIVVGGVISFLLRVLRSLLAMHSQTNHVTKMEGCA
jgi:hypothetical protein